MIRRSLGAALWTLVGLLAGFLGALSSLVGTGAGRALLARVSEGALHQVFTGTMEIGDVHGSLLTGLTLSQVRLFDADTTLDAWLSALQVSSPRERGIRIDISRLAMESSDPAVRVEDAVGRLRVIGDSMDVQLARVRLPHSALRDARGTLRWPHGPLLFDLRLRADSATLDDFP